MKWSYSEIVHTLLFAVTAAMLAVLIQGCGVSIEAKHISSPAAGGKVPFVIPNSGITAGLVKTKFDLVQPVSYIPPSRFPAGEFYEGCLQACKQTDNSEEKTRDACSLKSRSNIEFAQPLLRPVTVLDPSRLYQIVPSADIFQTSNFSVEGAANGTFESANVTVSNVAFDVAAAAAKYAASLMHARVKPLPDQTISSSLNKSLTEPQTCFDLATEIKKFSSNESGFLSCEKVKSIELCIDRDGGNAPSAERAALDHIYNQAANSKMDAALLTAIVNYRTARITNAEEKRNTVLAYYGVLREKLIAVPFDVIMGLDGPEEFRPYLDHADFENLDAIRENKWRIEGKDVNGGEHLANLISALKKSGRSYTISTDLPNEIEPAKITAVEEGKCARIRPLGPDVFLGTKEALENGDTIGTKECDKERAKLAHAKELRSRDELSIGTGFPYRIPMSAITSLTVSQSVKDEKSGTIKTTSSAPLRFENIIAQYGPIAALPSRFKGKGGSIKIKLRPESGGILTVEIGATGADASTVTSVIDTIQADQKAKRDKQEAAATAAAQTTPTIEELKKIKEELELRDAIRKLDAQQNGL